jgi:predicted metal-dependent peptidase
MTIRRAENEQAEPAWGTRLAEQVAQLQQRLDAVDRRVDQRLAELRAKQEEDLMLLKALSCQLRGRVDRADRRPGRSS